MAQRTDMVVVVMLVVVVCVCGVWCVCVVCGVWCVCSCHTHIHLLRLLRHFADATSVMVPSFWI